MQQREIIIAQYIAAYNAFDVEKMLLHLDDTIQFENLSNGVSNMSLNGIENFKAQAEQALGLFAARQQTIISWEHRDKETEIEIDYTATLAIDLPNGLKKGEQLNLKGRSIFTFLQDKIVALTDIS